MIKLLRAGVRRYLHSVVFWLASIVTVAVAVLCANGARNFYFEDFYIMIEFIIFAVMISWLVGGEYDEGIFRNKVISGHTKVSIFLSELILGVGTCLTLFLVFTAVFLLFNSYVFSAIPLSAVAKIFTDVLLVNICFASLTVTISCLIPHRAIIAIINILLVISIAFSSYTVESAVNQEEYYTEYQYEYTEKTDGDGNTFIESTQIEGTEHKVKNPKYISGVVREFCEVVYDVLPYGHITEYISLTSDWFGYDSYELYSNDDTTWEEEHKDMKISDEDNQKINVNLIYSGVVTAVVCGVGVVFYRKRELK